MGVSWTTVRHPNLRMDILVGEPPVRQNLDCWDGVWQHEQWHGTSFSVLSPKKRHLELKIVAEGFCCSILWLNASEHWLSTGSMKMLANLTQSSRELDMFPKKKRVPINSILDLGYVFSIFFHWSTVDQLLCLMIHESSPAMCRGREAHRFWWESAREVSLGPWGCGTGYQNRWDFHRFS